MHHAFASRFCCWICELKEETTHANVLRYNDWIAIKYCKSETTKFCILLCIIIIKLPNFG